MPNIKYKSKKNKIKIHKYYKNIHKYKHIHKNIDILKINTIQ